MNITKEGYKLRLAMSDYVMNTINEIDMEDFKPKHTLIAPGTTLEMNEKQSLEKPNRSSLGRVIWIVKMKPDLNYLTNLFCGCAQKLREDAWKLLKRVNRYLNEMRNFYS